MSFLVSSLGLATHSLYPTYDYHRMRQEKAKARAEAEKKTGAVVATMIGTDVNVNHTQNEIVAPKSWFQRVISVMTAPTPIDDKDAWVHALIRCQ